MAQFVRGSWLGFEAQHRWEDLDLIRRTIIEKKPKVSIELGTALGGFSALLADTVSEWGGKVYTFDKVRHEGVIDELEKRFLNLKFIQSDVIASPNPLVIDLLKSSDSVFLYCDNGNKLREMAFYAPYLPLGGLLGCHDYGTEVPLSFASIITEHYGYLFYKQYEFEALTGPSYYLSLTRFWERTRLIGEILDYETVLQLGVNILRGGYEKNV
mgnify:FL=1